MEKSNVVDMPGRTVRRYGLNHAEYWMDQAAEHRDLIHAARVYIPIRPNAGMTSDLAKMLSIWFLEGLRWVDYRDPFGGFIEVTRASMVRDFLNGDGEYMIMIDDDMIPPIDLPTLLLRHRIEGVVGACCISFDREHGPHACFSVRDEAGAWRHPTMGSTRLPDKGLIDVGHVGTGAVCIHRTVLEAFQDRPPFFLPEEHRLRGVTRGRMERGEDIQFCVEARQLGFPIKVDLEAHVAHRKLMNLEWDASECDPLLDAADFVLPEAGMLANAGPSEEDT